MDKKDFLLRAIECKTKNMPEHRLECLICPYGKGLDFSRGDSPEDAECQKEKILEDMKEILGINKSQIT